MSHRFNQGLAGTFLLSHMALTWVTQWNLAGNWAGHGVVSKMSLLICQVPWRKAGSRSLSLSLCTVSTSPHDISWKIVELLPWWFRNPGSCGTGYKAFHGLALEVLECYPIILYLSSMFFKPTQNQEKENSLPPLTGGAMKYLWFSIIYHAASKFIIFPHCRT